MAFVKLGSTALFNDATLQAYYELENVNDSKNSNTLTNNGTTTFAAAKFSNGAVFDGTSAKYLTIADNLSLSTYQAGVFSVSMWVNITTAPSSGVDQYLAAITKSTELQFLIAYANDGGTLKLGTRCYNGSGSEFLSIAKTLSTGNWYHICLVKNGTTLTWYVNGTLLGTTTITLADASPSRANQFTLGTNGFSNTDGPLNGKVDDVGVFTKALSPSEILLLATGNLDLSDNTANANTLTNVNGPTLVTTDLPFGTATGAAKFDEAFGQYLQASDSAPTSVTGDFTLAYWVKFESIPDDTWRGMVGKGSDGSTLSYQTRFLRLSGTNYVKIDVSSNGTNDARVYWNHTPTPGTWYHYAFSCTIANANSSKFVFYVNGSSQGNGTVEINDSVSSVYDSAQGLRIGAASQFMHGQIADVRLYNSVISDFTNRSEYISGATSGLQADWQLGEEVTSIAYTKDFTETTVDLTESIVKATSKSLTESTVTLTESIVKAVTRVFTETEVALTEVFEAIKIILVTFTENTITTSETIIKAIGKNIAETTTLTESMTRAFTRIFTETTVTLTETFAYAFSYFKTFTETTVSLTESIQRDITRSFTESTVSLTSTLEIAHGYLKSLTESTVTLTETIVKAITKSLTETPVTVTSTLIRFFNGFRVSIWTKIQKTTAIWTKQGRPD